MRTSITILAITVVVWMVSPSQAGAQGFGDPLTFQGLNHTTAQSVASRASGGLTFGFGNDVSLMFSNPASMARVERTQVSIGGLRQYTYGKQDQMYGGLQNHAAFSLLMLATTGDLRDPDTSLVYSGNRVHVRTQADSVQRPFDSIGPDWNKSGSKSLPIQAFVATPFSFEGIQFVGGVGAVEYANLNWYYGNNNSLSPSVLSVADSTILTANLPQYDSVATSTKQPYLVQWYQSIQQRDGSIYGYGGALSAQISPGLSVGASFLILTGSTTDREIRVGRGEMEFFSSSLRLVKQGMTSYTKTGTSDYSGQELSLSAEYRTRYVTFGFSAKLPTTIKRSYTATISSDSVASTQKYAGRIDSVHVTGVSLVSGEDKISLPLRGNIGIGLKLKENLTFGVEFEIRSYASAKYTNAGGAVTNPWLSSTVLHFGGEYMPATWISLRGGVYTYSEVFQPVTAGIRGEPVNYPVYSFGCGIKIADGVLNLAYEYSEMKYVDTWSNAASVNQSFTNNIVASFTYQLPW